MWNEITDLSAFGIMTGCLSSLQWLEARGTDSLVTAIENGI